MKKLNKAQSAKLAAISTVAGKIRFLDGLRLTRSEIAKHLNKRYQHVRNVLTQPAPLAK